MTNRCDGCRSGERFPLDFTMAFQPILDIERRTVWGYEALVRGVGGEGAGTILEAVTEANRYVFDQACRVKAIELAGRSLSDGSARLSINFMPNAVYEPKACIRATLEAAGRVGFDPRRLMFEFTEGERIGDVAHLENILTTYRQMGFATALDDFGAGYAGLGLLARLQPDVLKIDMEIVQAVSTSRARRAIVGGVVKIARDLDIDVLAEGVEHVDDFECLRDMGIGLFQGYLFARPELETFRPADQIPMLKGGG